jgi:6-phosphogluconolactonase
MIKGKIIYSKDSEEFIKVILDLFLKTIDDCIIKNGECFLAVSGGTTPQPIFKILANKYYQKYLDWTCVHIFFVDERCVPIDHSDNNYKNCYENWLQFVPSINSHYIESWLEPCDAAQKYEKEIIACLNKKNGIPQFDLIFMGIGNDGHIASLFPGYNFEINNSSFVEDIYIKSKKMNRITMTLPLLNNAKNRIIAIIGNEKKKIFKHILKSDLRDYPVGKLLDSNSNDFWVIG